MKKNGTGSKSLNLKNIIALFLCISMLFAMAACNGSKKGVSSQDTASQAKESTVSDYLTIGGVLPIVKQGYDKGFSMAIQMADNAGKPEDLWFYKFITSSMNIKATIKPFTTQNRNEFISLLFASNDLPDLIIGAKLTADEMMRYGKGEKQLLDLAPYINEKYMPNLTKIYNNNPTWKNVLMDSDGRIYSLGYINSPYDQGQISRLFYNYDWLDKLGLKVPTTLDEFVNMLRAFKSLDNNIIPFGGSYKNANSTLVILNAFGYNTEEPRGTAIGLRNGKVVLPVADREAYGKYLETMNTLYKEGLIAKDFYTMDLNAVKANVSEGRNGVIAEAPFVYTQKYTEWWGGKPLTSQYNSKAFWPCSRYAVSAGQFAVSSKCKTPELAVAFADWFFDSDSKNYTLSVNGAPSNATDILYGTTGWSVDDKTRSVVFSDYENNKSKYTSKNDFLVQKVTLLNNKILGYGYWSTVGTWAYQLLAGYPADKCIDGYPDKSKYTGTEPFRHTFKDGEAHFRMALKDTMVSYVVDGFPSYVYFDPDKTAEITNLSTVLTQYAEQESAKFITGARPLSEINSYFDAMDKLGAQKYVQYFADYYKAFNTNKK